MVEVAYPLGGLTKPNDWGDKAILYSLDHDMFGLTSEPYELWEKNAFKKTTVGAIKENGNLVFDIPQDIALAYFFGKKIATIMDVMDKKQECLLVLCQQ